jgi:cytochrome b subunit of formate dehydrogenase
MNKINLKFYVDGLLFLDFLVLAISGFILMWFYPAGEKSGRAGVLFLFDRFQWLKIHDVTAIILVVLLLIHLFLNWNWIQCMFINLINKNKNKNKK